MANQLRLLRKENKLRKACLKEENQTMLDKWIAYAKTSDMNPYDFELCCKELIGIALQKEMEGKDLEHFFGDEQQEIAENIIAGCDKKTAKDYILFDLREILGILAIWTFLMYLLSGEFSQPFTLYDVAYFLIWTGLFFPYIKISSSAKIRVRLSSKHLETKEILRIIMLVGICAILHFIHYQFEPLTHIVIPNFPNIIFSLLCGILWIILSIYQNKYINRLATLRPWQDV